MILFAKKNMFFASEILSFDAKDMHINALAKNPILPEVNTPTLLYFSSIILSHNLASLLFLFAVIAVDFFARLQHFTFDIVFPEIEIKYK